MTTVDTCDGKEIDPPTFEDVLEELGTPGRFQLTQIFTIFSFSGLAGFVTMGYVFQAYSPPHVCNNVNESIFLAEHGIRFNTSTVVTVESCDIKVSSNDTLTGVTRDIARLSCPDGRNYSDAKHTTWVSEWDLACESQGLVESTYTMLTAGQLVGGILASYFTDRFGRKPIILACTIGVLISETAILFAPSIYLIIALKFTTGFFYKGAMSSGYVYAMEYVAPKHRTIFGPTSALTWVVSILVVGGIAYILRDSDWKYFQGATSVCNVICLAIYYLNLQESPRWLAANNRIDEALLVLKKASQKNGKEFPKIKATFLAYVHHSFSFTPKEASVPLENGAGVNKIETTKENVKNEKVPLSTLFRNKYILFPMLIMAYIWLTNVLTYYGLYMTSTKWAGDRFLNYALIMLAEIPSTGLAYLSLKFLGRRLNLVIYLGLTGSSLMISTLLVTFGSAMKGSAIASTTLIVVGKWAITASFCVTYLMTPELFPTNLRSTASGFCNSISRVGSMVAPYMTLLYDVVNWGPSLIFTVMCVLGMFLAMFLPETKGMDLPNTVEDIVEQRKNKKHMKI